MKCQECGNEIPKKKPRKGQRFCRSVCRQRAYDRRKREKIENMKTELRRLREAPPP